jgi:hypothetical protein
MGFKSGDNADQGRVRMWFLLRTFMATREIYVIKIKKGVMFLFLTSIYNMLFSVNFALRVKVSFFRHCYVTNVMLTFYPVHPL